MTWTNPITWAFQQVWSATIFNQQFRDNLNYLKTRPYDVAEIGSTNQTGITTSWVKVTGSDLTVVLPVAAVLEFNWRLTFTHSAASSSVAVDIFDVDNAVYLSSGTGTPATHGLQRVPTHATIGQAAANVGSYIHIAVPLGTHNYEIRIIAAAASATLVNASVKNTAWVKEVA